MPTKTKKTFKRLTIEEERALICKCVSGEEGAFEAFLNQFDRLIYSIVIKRLENHILYRKPSRTEKQEYFNVVIIKFAENDWKKLRSFSYKCKLSTWVSTCTVNTLRDNAKKERNFNSKIVSHPKIFYRHDDGEEDQRCLDINRKDAHEEACEAERKTTTYELFNKALTVLNEMEEKVIRLMCLRDMKPQPLANLLGIKRSYVDVLYDRAKKKIREKMTKQYQPEILEYFFFS